MAKPLYSVSDESGIVLKINATSVVDAAEQFCKKTYTMSEAESESPFELAVTSPDGLISEVAVYADVDVSYSAFVN